MKALVNFLNRSITIKSIFVTLINVTLLFAQLPFPASNLRGVVYSKRTTAKTHTSLHLINLGNRYFAWNKLSQSITWSPDFPRNHLLVFTIGGNQMDARWLGWHLPAMSTTLYSRLTLHHADVQLWWTVWCPEWETLTRGTGAGCSSSASFGS